MTIQLLMDAGSKIAAYPDNWDGEGSVGYTHATIIRAITFIQRYHQMQSFKLPDLLPGPNGSIDLLWKYRDGGKTLFHLLINVPAADDREMTFYGAVDLPTKGHKEVKGILYDVEHGMVEQWLFDFIRQYC